MVKKIGKRQKRQLKTKAMDKFELVEPVPLTDREMDYKFKMLLDCLNNMAN